MIELTRLQGQKIVINVELIEFIDDLFPFGQRHQDCLATLILVNDVLWMNRDHFASSLATTRKTTTGQRSPCSPETWVLSTPCNPGPLLPPHFHLQLARVVVQLAGRIVDL